MKYIISVLTLLISLSLFAQENNFLMSNVTIHTATGKTIKKGFLAVKDGLIDFVGEKEPSGEYNNKIDGQGQHVYPGIIAPNTRLGLEEIQAVRATLDYREVGRFNPNVRSIIAYNTDSEVVPTVRSNGVLFAQVVPEGGRMSGQSSIVYTSGDNWEDAAFEMDNCVHLRWPSRIYYTGWWAQKGRTEMSKNYAKQVEAIRVYFDAAMAYSKKESVESKNLKFETMKALFNKEKFVIVHVNEVKAMIDAVSLLKAYGIKIILQGANDAWKITDFLKENDISLILNDIHKLPSRDDDDIDQPFKTPKMLKDAGIKFCFSLNNQGSWNVRNLVFQAGQAIAYGLDKEAALQALTLSAAEILGVDKKIGSLEKGKEASFIVVKGDLLDMRSSVVTGAYIKGKKISLEDKQKALYRKYMEKYNLEETK